MEMNGHVPNGDTAHNHFQPILHEVEETLSHLPELLYSKADSSLPPSESEDDEELSASDASVPEAEDEDDAVPPQSDDEEDNEAHLLAPGLSSPMDEHVSQSGWARSEEPHWRPAEFPEASGWVVLGTMLSYTFLFMFGYLRDFLRYIGWEKVVGAKDLDKHKDFVPLLSDFENFYIVNVVRRTYDCWKRPICAVPGATTTCMERVTYDGGFTYKMTGRTSTILNLSSYNYLGFAQNTGPCAVATKEAIRRDGIATCSHRQDLGNAVIHRELETLVAEFLGAEDAVCYPMGYATNSMNMPAIAGKGCLLLSDELNHSSLITGIKLSGATKRIFKHNDMEDLERKLRDAIIMGQPRTRRPFKKIIVIVEGVYSMEGTIVNLPAVIALKKKYKAYLYLDEAHSVGAMGPHGRGVVDYWGCDPRDVDILMGTFTKSFGSVGGYIAGSKVLSAMGIIKGQDGTTDGQDRIRRLRRNSIYFRRQLKARGFIVYGHDDSPVIPLLLYSFPMVSAFSRDMLARFGMATVTVAFPATPIYLGRARFCVSSAHTQRMIDLAVEAIDELGDEMGLKFLGARDTLPAIPY